MNSSIMRVMKNRRVILAALILLIVCGSAVVHEKFNRKHFDGAAWRAAQPEGVRLKMADDMIAHNRLMGKSLHEVIDWLGIPPQTEYFKDYDYVYLLGRERGFISIDSEWLVIKIKEDKVIEAKIMRD